jgi:hypothetical protein
VHNFRKNLKRRYKPWAKEMEVAEIVAEIETIFPEGKSQLELLEAEISQATEEDIDVNKVKKGRKPRRGKKGGRR